MDRQNNQQESKGTKTACAMSQKPKGSVRTKVSVALLALLILSMISATFAWFTISEFSSVNNMNISIGSGVQLFISGEDHGADITLYGKELTNEDINAQLAEGVSLDDFVLFPVTSTNGREMYTQSGDLKAANSNSYLEFTAYLISTESMWVHLTSEDTEVGANNGTKVATTDTGVRADIVKCARVSFTDEENNKTVIYEPGKTNGADVAGQTTFDLPSPMKLSDSTRVCYLEKMTPKKVVIRIWIDGEDPECDDDVQLSNLQVRLNFRGTDENNVPVN